MTVPWSNTYWLQFCIVGGSGARSSIFCTVILLHCWLQPIPLQTPDEAGRATSSPQNRGDPEATKPKSLCHLATPKMWLYCALKQTTEQLFTGLHIEFFFTLLNHYDLLAIGYYSYSFF